MKQGSPNRSRRGAVSSTPLRVAGLVSLLLLAACRKEAPAPAPAPAASPEVANPLARTVVAAPLRGERPDGWINSLPDRPAVVLAVDLRSMMETVVEGPWNLLELSQTQYAEAVSKWVGKFDDRPDLANAVKQLKWESASTVVLAGWGTGAGGAESIVLLTDPAALDLPLRDGGPPATLTNTRFRAAVRGSRLILGDGPAFDAALSQQSAFHPEQRWAEGWSRLPKRSLATLWLDPSVPSPKSAEPLQRGHQLLVAGVASDGSALVLHGAQQPWLTPAAARGFQLGRSLLESQRADASKSSRPLWEYADLLHRAIWSRIRLTTEGQVEALALAPPSCGNAANNLAVAAIVATLMERGAAGPAPTEPFVTPEVALEPGCTGVAGPAPRLPRSLVSLAAPNLKGGAAVLLADQAALFRTHLPSLFGLLPFTLKAEELTKTIGAQPFGLRSWSDAEGSGALILEQATNASVTVLHPGASSLPWFGALAQGQERVTDPRRGLVIGRGVPAVRDRLAASPQGESVWAHGATLPSDDTLVALLLNRTYLAAAVSYAARPDLQQALARAEVVSFSLRQDLSPEIGVWLPEGASEAASLLHDTVQEGVAQATLSAEQEGSEGGTVADALKLVTVEALDAHRVRISLSRGGPFVVAATAMLAAPVAAEVYGIAGRITAASAKPPTAAKRP